MSRKNYRILQIDDDPKFHREMRFMFGTHFEFEGVTNEERLKDKIKIKQNFDLVLLDLVLDDTNEFKGLTLINSIRETWPGIPIIVITQDKQPSTIAKAIRAGANYFLEKSAFDVEMWDELFLEAIEQKEEKEDLKTKLKKEQESKEDLKHQLEKEKEKNEYIEPEHNPFIGNSSRIQLLKRTLKIVADEPDVTVMITGETGVGKGVAARFLHANSAVRRHKPFQEINISSIPKDLVPSQLFGHKKGSFTGAFDDQKGRLEMANHGIVFLDEIGELDLDNQVKLLNFLQDKTITPLGSDKTLKLDVQIVAATNKSLRDEVKKGNFREDLFHRLQVFPIEIPPLRERREDILPLLTYFIKSTGRGIYEQIEADALKFLIEQCLWTGNIRQLENEVQSMLLRRKVLGLEKINMDCLREDLFDNNIRMTPINFEFNNIANTQLDAPININRYGSFKTLDEKHAFEKLEKIENALIEKNKKKKDVAMILGYKTDDNLRYKVKIFLADYPHLAEKFPTIQEAYHRLIKELNIEQSSSE